MRVSSRACAIAVAIAIVAALASVPALAQAPLPTALNVEVEAATLALFFDKHLGK